MIRPLTILNIKAGSHFVESVANVVGDDGLPVPFISDGDWAAKATIRTGFNASVVMTFASDGSGDGGITFDDIGNVTLFASSTFTAALSPTTSVQNLQGAVYVGDLELWNIGTPTDRWSVTDFKVRIYPEATT